MATRQNDPKLMDTTQESSHDAYELEPQDGEQTEAQAQQAQATVNRQTLPSWFTTDFEFQRVSKEIPVATLISQGKRAFFLRLKPGVYEKYLKAAIKVLDELKGQIPKMSQAHREYCEKLIPAVTGLDQLRGSHREWNAGKTLKSIADQVAQDCAYIALQTTAFRNYATSPQYNEDKGGSWESNILTTFEEAAPELAAVWAINSTQVINLKQAVFRALDFKRSKLQNEYLHQEEIEAKNALKGDQVTGTRTALVDRFAA